MSEELSTVGKLRVRAAARLSLKRPSKTDCADAALDTEAADHIKSLEAKLEKAREGLEGARDFLIDEVGFADSDPPLEQVQAALKELSQ